ncbi:hypothetical protein PENSPDRAFT_646668 [Peniophora sp. CONT]|nr:hypothetical protein PENSPDRAFT_646668 [Peniophora sp. CONT]
MSSSSSSSPAAYHDVLPPREPSPVPFNALSPAPCNALRSQRSRQRLRLPLPQPESPPIPPTLIGSPLLQNIKPRTRTVSMSPDASAKENVERRRTRSAHHRRTSSISISPNSTTRTNARARSPPPSPRRPSIAPPVPPIPEFARAEARQAVLRPRVVADDVMPTITISPPVQDAPLRQSRTPAGTRGAAPAKGFTCINFLALHNSRGPISVSAY